MTLNPQFLTVDMSLVPALEAWAVHASLRGKTVQENMRKAMRFAVDFALRRTPRGDRAKIRTDLMKVIAEYRRTPRGGSRAGEKYRGTMAAALVMKLDYRGARALAKARSPEFYTHAVAPFVKARQYATNLHAAGWKPAQRALRGAPAGRMPDYKHPPGRFSEDFSGDIAEILAENEAEAAPVPGRPAPIGISGLLTDLDTVLPDLERLFTKFLAQDLVRASGAAGFTRDQWDNF